MWDSLPQAVSEVYHCNLRRSPSLLYFNADYQQIFSEISETPGSGINLQRTTASSRRTASLCRIGINECRELWLTYKRYLYICYQYHHLPDCFYRNEKIQGQSDSDDYRLRYCRIAALLKLYLFTYGLRFIM